MEGRALEVKGLAAPAGALLARAEGAEVLGGLGNDVGAKLRCGRARRSEIANTGRLRHADEPNTHLHLDASGGLAADFHVKEHDRVRHVVFWFTLRVLLLREACVCGKGGGRSRGQRSDRAPCTCGVGLFYRPAISAHSEEAFARCLRARRASVSHLRCGRRAVSRVVVCFGSGRFKDTFRSRRRLAASSSLEISPSYGAYAWRTFVRESTQAVAHTHARTHAHIHSQREGGREREDGTTAPRDRPAR